MKAEGSGPSSERKPGSIFRVTLQLLLLAMVVYAVHLLLDWTAVLTHEGREGLRLSVLASLIAIYILLMALPFVPGIEVSMSLLIIEGQRIAPVIYLATLTALLLAYATGAWLPHSRLSILLRDLHLRRAGNLLDRVTPLGRQERLAVLSETAPLWLRPLVTRYRYLLLAALLNIPGNAIIGGGGGGIMFIAGLSRMFHPAVTALTIALAVAPVPLAVWFFGVDLINR